DGHVDGGLECARDAEVLGDLVRRAARDDGERDVGAGETGRGLGEGTVAAAHGDGGVPEGGGLARELRRVSRTFRRDEIERRAALRERAAEATAEATFIVVAGVRIDDDEGPAGGFAGRTN